MLSVNTNGVKQNGRKLSERVVSQFHVIALQETKFRNAHHLSKFLFNVSTISRHTVFVSDRNSGNPAQISPRSGGVATLLHPELPGVDTAKVVTEATVEGRYLLVRMEVDGQPIYIHNVYAPVRQTDRVGFFAGLPTSFEDSSHHIVMGDFNVAIDPVLDSRGTAQLSDATRGELISWLASIRVIDPWRLRFPDRRLFSGPLPRINRLDYICISDTWVDTLFDSAKYYQAPHTGDHLAVRLSLGEARRRPSAGYWRLRPETLDNHAVRRATVLGIQTLAATIHSVPNPGPVWEGWKRRIRGQLQLAQTQVYTRANLLLSACQRDLTHCHRAHAASNSDESAAALIQAVETEEAVQQHLLEQRQDQGFDFHAHEMEASTSGFFRPPDSVLRSTAIPAIVLESGVESNDPADISAVFRSHWGSIFGDPKYGSEDTRVDNTMTDQLLNSVVSRLDDAQAAILDAPITTDELARTILHLKKRSAPGLDGLGAARYMLDPEAFGEVLSVVFASELENGRLLSSQRKSCVSLLYKKGDRRDPGNYRPISLMQVDVKILSKTLAYRLQRFLPDLIHSDQKGFVKGRSLHHHVRFLHDIQSLLQRRGAKGYALFLDFAKAYDRVNWNYLFQVLERAGFGEVFCSWVRLLYSGVQATLSLNGTLQEALFPTRGVKQGDPLSSLLFVLSIEPRGNLLRAQPDLGLPISAGLNATGIYFADDSTLFSNSLAGLARQVEIVRSYCAGSGALLNLEKSQLFTFHDERVSAQDSLVGLNSSESIKYLGIPFGQGVSDASIFASLESRIGSRLARWGVRARTYRGRLLILQTMVLSILWHFTPHFTMPTAMVKRLQSLVDKYLLTRSADPSRRFVKLAKASICHVSFNNGGLQIPLLQRIVTVQRMRLFQQLVNMDTDELWRTTTSALLAHIVPGGSSGAPFDFLSCPHTFRSAIVDVVSLTVWWRSTWKVWSSMSWMPGEISVDPVHFQHSLLRAYVWHSTHPLLVVANDTNSSLTLLGKTGATRKFRTQFAEATGCRCLLDFMNGGWPEAPTFMARFLLAVPEWPLRYQMRHLNKLYYDLRRIYAMVTGPLGPLHGPCTPTLPLPLVGIRRTKVELFPHLQKDAMKTLLGPSQMPVRDHPLFYQVDDFNRADLVATVAALKMLRRVVLPVYSDLHFRLSWKLLPTRSRFHYLRTLSSSDLTCAYSGCSDIETDRHLFFDCARASSLWRIITHDWDGILDGPVTWTMITTLQEPVWAICQNDLAEHFSTLWMVMRTIVLYVLWTARNKHQFEDHQPPDAPTTSFRVYAVFGAHFRALLRSSSPSTQSKQQRCLLVFSPATRLRRFMVTHPRVFTVRHDAWFLNDSGLLTAPPTYRTTNV